MQDEDADVDVKPSMAHLAAVANGVSTQSRKAGIGKNPHVATEFLPDRDREAAEVKLRQQLRTEYELRQQVRQERLLLLC